MREVPERSDTPLLLSHHHPDQYDRCVRLGQRHICRRCLVLYPIALVALVVSASALGSDHVIDPIILVLLPLPAVVEWWLEHLHRVRYSPARQVAVTIPLAIALGRALARYLADPTDIWFWLVVAVYGGSCAAVAFWRFLDATEP